MQKYKGSEEATKSNYMPIKWTTWRKWTNSFFLYLYLFFYFFKSLILTCVPKHGRILRKTEPGRNRKYEQINHKHGKRNCNKNSPNEQKPRARWLHRQILPKVWRRANNYVAITLPEN